MFELFNEPPKTIFTITRAGKIEFADGISKDEATTQAAQLLAEKFSALHQAQAAEITRLRAASDEVKGYLSRLLQSLHPKIDLLPDLLGVCTQIDNVLAGQRAENARLRETLP